MNRHIVIAAAAAALTVGGFARAADVTDSVHNATTKMGIGSADKASEHQSKHAEEIHDVLAQVAEAAVTKNGLDDMAERFVDADRNRLGQNKDALKSDDTLNGRIAELQKDWKAKYNNDFDIKDEDKTYNLAFAQIGEGEEGARTASGKVAGDPANANPAENKTGIDRPNVNKGTETAADTNRNDPGRNIATVHIAESHGLPALDVPMIHEAGGWKLDIPDSVDAAKLHANVLTALTEIDQKKADWAADADDAYRFATHRILLGVFDKSPTAAGATDTGSMTPAVTPPATPGAPVTPAPTPVR